VLGQKEKQKLNGDVAEGEGRIERKRPQGRRLGQMMKGKGELFVQELGGCPTPFGPKRETPW